MTQDKYHPIPGEMDGERVRETLKNYLKTNRIRITDTGYQDKMKHITDSVDCLRKLKIAVEALEKMRSPYAMDRQGVANEALGKIGEVK